jgi:hypothetical protein
MKHFLFLFLISTQICLAADNSVYIDQGAGSANNSITIEQTVHSTGKNAVDITITGIGNIGTVNQIANSNAYHNFTAVITGNTNSFNVTQSGNSGHTLELTLTGNGHAASVTQQGNNGHQANITLINAGGASNLNLNQQSNIGQNYSIIQQCANSAGCAVSVTQSGQ